ncbi:MAG: hypothetical protein A3F90_04155 [Deltaproteobacteria bacterium RIFCSPLOWO2_12_FULL_60_19]|nr:MAG: hypothetical protein A3F90_04155 [Deltaproteobacteria bacterium RIFCSPLOWO2_12_FULL_60_19]
MKSRVAPGPLIRVIALGGIGAIYWVGYALSLFDYSDVVVMATGWGVPIYIAFWAQNDSQSSGYWPAFHYAWYLIGFWPIALPHYLIRTRGTRGIPILALFVLLLTSWFWGYWLGILVGWSLGWYSSEAIRGLWNAAP